ncbi:MAG: UvrD-helicase domain-containing protein [Treponema sp.]|jgi:ATP-dependent helicase/nuclease subunit A|nr:UvrD-helicase domain-containing protein [Treponema sp.]
MSVENLLTGLDPEQRKAAAAERNTVVTAGAGSGKTKVLASRYAWLVMEKGYKVDEILTLTFTNKAVNEMYSRIYTFLADRRDNERARKAVEEFHKARILTLDAFSAAVARTASSRYGISSDFTSDNQGVRELAMDTALPFVLAHRDNPALQVIIADRKIRTVAEELFADTVLKHSPISRPPDFGGFMRRQHEEIVRQWNSKTGEAAGIVSVIREELRGITKKTVKLYTALQDLFRTPQPEKPDIVPLLDNTGGPPRRNITEYFSWLNRLQSVNLNVGSSREFTAITENIKALRELYGSLGSFANTALQSRVIAEVLLLVEEFQRQFNKQKRSAGILTFDDIACLAADALSGHPDVRRVYKDACKAVMVDEFQDNNGLQRDLIFLLAENLDRNAAGIPDPEELRKDVMFFVGDEKQSIYRFRGADVSVFRSLARSLAPAGGDGPETGTGAGVLNLARNYRSSPRLIDAFNRIFGGLAPEPAAGTEQGAVFLPDNEELPGFEAAYHRVYAPDNVLEEKGAEDQQNPPVHFCFLDKGRLSRDDPGELTDYELEAAYIAERIREMVDSGRLVRERSPEGARRRPCRYGDFAVLQRSYTHQSSLERQFKNFGVPFTAERPSGIFSDAPVNDLLMFLRLLAYPEDRLAYGALIRSPFMRLSDLTLSVCLLSGSAVPFDEALEEAIPPEDRELYRLARKRYRTLAEDARTLPVTELLTKLWYGEGYRYETIWSETSQIYGELFDLFFETARNMDNRGKSLAEFLDYMNDIIKMEEKLDDVSIPPLEESTGVRIMSIHKSKGLEFPIVFVYRCGGNRKNRGNRETAYFDERWGLTLNLPQAEELPGQFENYFFNLSREEENRKETAELRRLLYVAMTRAESRLFLTASLPEPDKNEKKSGDKDGRSNGEDPADGEYTVQSLKERLAYLKAKKQDKEAASSFLDLLLPVIAAEEDGEEPFTLEIIPVRTREEIRLAAGRIRSGGTVFMAEAADAAAPCYARAEVTAVPPPPLTSIPASKLQDFFAGDAASSVPDAIRQADGDPIDAVLDRAGLEAADFGTIVHGFLEALLKGGDPQIPPRIQARLDDRDIPLVRETAETMARGFLDSDLGKLSMKAAYHEEEFPIITMAETGTGKIPIIGKIDLLFESEGVMHVADFKTDRIEDPKRHYLQLAVYSRAVSDIFGKPVRAWLFYLRGGKDVEITRQIRDLDLVIDTEKIRRPLTGPQEKRKG